MLLRVCLSNESLNHPRWNFFARKECTSLIVDNLAEDRNNNLILAKNCTDKH